MNILNPVNFNGLQGTNLADPTSAQNAATKNYVDTKVISLLFGGTGNTSLITSPTASTIVGQDANRNYSSNNFIEGYQSIATAAGTTGLTVGSPFINMFTGTTTQTVLLPASSTLVYGQQFQVVNTSTGIVTVQTSNGTALQVQAANTTAVYTCVLTSGTTAASWSVSYMSNNGLLSVSNSDGSLTVTPTTGAVVASLNTANSNTFTAAQILTLSNLTTTVVPALTLKNTTAATSASPYQNSPALYFISNGWNSVVAPAQSQSTTWRTYASVPNEESAGSIESLYTVDYVNGATVPVTTTGFQIDPISQSFTIGGTLFLSTQSIKPGVNSNLTVTIPTAGFKPTFVNSFTATGAGGFIITPTTITSTSGSVAVATINPTYNQASGTASNTDLLINRAQTTVGSGTQRLISGQIAGSEVFGVDNKGKINQVTGGTNSPIGTATLLSGTVTVSNTLVTANSIIFVSCNTPSGTQGFLSAPSGNIVAGTSFKINSSSTTDNSTVYWEIRN